MYSCLLVKSSIPLLCTSDQVSHVPLEHHILTLLSPRIGISVYLVIAHLKVRRVEAPYNYELPQSVTPKHPIQPNKVMIWDDHQSHRIGEEY